jgi:DNA-binding beta-propeller fold protein YncE
MNVTRLYLLFLLAFLLIVVPISAQQGWYPPEGGLLRYRVNQLFGKEPRTMPDGFEFGAVVSVATDSRGEVYVFHRGPSGDPLIVFDSQGRYLRSWGKGLITHAHNIRFDLEGNLWITDDAGSQLLKFSKEGKLLQTFGTKDKPGKDERSFGGPADIAFAKNGDFYVADGNGRNRNERIVKYSRDGKFLKAWGKPGSGPGEFDVIHSLVLDSKGYLYVSDHHNNRFQIFDSEGRFVKQWTHLGPAQGLYMTPKDELFALVIRSQEENSLSVGLAGKIMKIDPATGNVLGSIASPGHSIHVGSDGVIWVGSLSGNVLKWSAATATSGRGQGRAPVSK